jgi:hypothetical protein
VKEARPRLSIYLLATAVSVIILAALAAFYVWRQNHPLAVVEEPRLEQALRAGSPDFDQYRERLKVEGLAATQSSRALGDIVMELTATVRNATGRTISGLELRGAVVDAQGAPVGERTVVVIPGQQASLKPDETMSVRLLIEGIKPEADRSNIRLEVAGVRVD